MYCLKLCPSFIISCIKLSILFLFSLKIVDTYTSYERHDYKKSNSRKDVQFCCDQCGYKSKRKGDLKKHIDSVHGEVRYSCDQCDYKATQKRSLKKHIDAVHEGVWHKTKRKDNLKRHIDYDCAVAISVITRQRPAVDFT